MFGFGRAALFALAAGACTCACDAKVVLELPQANGAQSALLLIKRPGDPITARAFTYPAPFLATPIALTEVHLYALLSNDSLADLQLVEGPLALSSDPTPASRALPADQIFVADISSGEAGEWSAVRELPSTLAELRLLPLDGKACFDENRCIDLARGRCFAACDVSDPKPPMPPEKPQSDCPNDWEPIVEDGVSYCAPIGRDLVCADDEVWFPSRRACEPIGDPCPLGQDWANNVPAGAIYVRDGAMGGVGSRAAPFGTFEAAFTEATKGSTIALSQGQFTITGSVAKPGVVIWGACAGTILERSSSEATVHVTQRDVRLKNLTVAAAYRGILVDAGNSVSVEDVSIINVTGSGIETQQSASAFAKRTVIRALSTNPVAAGLRAQGGSMIEAQGIAIAGGGQSVGLFGPGSQIIIEDAVLSDTTVAVVNTEPTEAGTAGGSLTLTRALIEGSGTGLSLECTDAVLTDVYIRDAPDHAISLDDSDAGVHVSCLEMATLTATRLVVERSGPISVVGPKANATLYDLVDLRPTGPSLAAEAKGTLTLTRAVINGAAMFHDGTFTANDLEMRGVLCDTCDAIELKESSNVTLTRVALANGGARLDDGTAQNLTVTDVLIQTSSRAAISVGCEEQRGCSVNATRFSIVASGGGGIEVSGEGAFNGRDVSITGAGISVRSGTIVMSSFSISEAPAAAIQLVRDNGLDATLSLGKLSSNPIALDISGASDYPLEKLLDRVVLTGNGIAVKR